MLLSAVCVVLAFALDISGGSSIVPDRILRVLSRRVVILAQNNATVITVVTVEHHTPSPYRYVSLLYLTPGTSCLLVGFLVVWSKCPILLVVRWPVRRALRSRFLP